MNKISGILKTRKIFMGFIAVYVLTYTAFLVTFKNSEYVRVVGGDAFSTGSAIVASSCFLYACRKTLGDIRIFWLLLFLGSLGYLSGELIYDYYEMILKTHVPYPGISDFFYLLFPFLSLLGLVYIIYKRKSLNESLRFLFDFFIVITVLGTLSYYYLIKPQIGNDMRLIYILIVSAYPITEFALLFGLMAIYSLKNTFSRKLLMIFTLGLFLFIITGVLFQYLTIRNMYFSGCLLDPMWALAVMVIGLSGFYNDEKYIVYDDNIAAELYNRPGMQLLHLIFPYFSLLLLLGLMLTKVKEVDSIVVGSIFAVILLVVRQMIIITENQNLLKRLEASNIELAASKRILEEKHRDLQSISSIREIEARTDFLTGLYNRRYIDEFLDMLLMESESVERDFCLFLLDIDHFKQINDEYGHELGDKLLRKVSAVMQENTRHNEIICRFGGDEFIGILPDVDIKKTRSIADRIRQQVEKHGFIYDEKKIKTTVSIGVTQLRINEDDKDSILARVDEALYLAKKKGRNNVQILK